MIFCIIVLFIPVFIVASPLIFILIMEHKAFKAVYEIKENPSPEPFLVSKYFDRMERESQRIRDEIKGKEPYVLVLWWGDDGLRLNEDDTTEWISKRPKPRNAINPVFNPINTAINADVIQSAPIHWTIESQIQSTEAQIAALQLQLCQCTQSATNSYLIEEIRPAPILGYEPIFARYSSGRFIRK